jgi:hypothetical protein
MKPVSQVLAALIRHDAEHGTRYLNTRQAMLAARRLGRL